MKAAKAVLKDWLCAAARSGASTPVAYLKSAFWEEEKCFI